MTGALSLWDPPVPTIQGRFEHWIASPDGLLVYEELVARALRLRRQGWTHYSHKAIVETIRYDRSIVLGPESGFRIQDHYTSRLARKAMAEYPELASFFETRELRAD